MCGKWNWLELRGKKGTNTAQGGVFAAQGIGTAQGRVFICRLEGIITVERRDGKGRWVCPIGNATPVWELCGDRVEMMCG